MHSGFLIKIRDSHRERISKVIELMSGGSDTTRHWFNALILGDAHGQSIQSWRSIGLGHLGAISGMHVGMLLFSALIPLRLLGLRMPWQAFVGMVVISVLLFTVPWRAPVLRASMNGLLVLPIFLALRDGYFYQPWLELHPPCFCSTHPFLLQLDSNARLSPRPPLACRCRE